MEKRSETAFLLGGPVVVAALSTCALSRFAARDMNWCSFLTAVLGITVAFGIVAVVPLDVHEALELAEKEAGGQQPERGESDPWSPLELLRKSWAAIYWSTAALCYLFCPLLMEYDASADFTVAARLRAALRRNAAFYAAYAVAGAAALVWLTVQGQVQGDLESWCIAASNAWGLFALTMLMGFGLVAIPRHLWGLADTARQLRGLYVSAVARDEERLSKLFTLQDTVGQVRAELEAHDIGGEDAEDSELTPKMRRSTTLAFTTLQQLLEKSQALHWQLSRTPVPNASGFSGSAVYQRTRHRRPAARFRHLVKLRRKLLEAGQEARRATCCWDNHVQRCIFFEDLERGHFKAAAELMSSRSPDGGLTGGCSRARHHACVCTVRLLSLWLRHLRARVLRALGYLCSLLSMVIVLGQLTMFVDRWNLSLLSLLFREDHGPWVTQMLCVMPLGYMAYSAYFSIFRLKIAGWYGLYGNHNTDAGSLLWCASLLARLAAPLCYHFLLLIRVKGTTFQAFMGQMNVVPVLGESFNQIFPIFVALLCCLNFFNVYRHLVRFATLGIIDFDLSANCESDDPLGEGRQLIERERVRRADEAASTLELPHRAAPQRLVMPLAAPAG